MSVPTANGLDTIGARRLVLTHAALVASAGRPIWNLILRGVRTRAEVAQPAVNDLPAGDVVVGCGEAATTRLSAVTDSPDGTRQGGELSRPASYGRHAPCDTSWATQPCGSKSTKVKSSELSEGNSHRGGPTCRTAAAKARTQQSPPRLPRPLGPGRTETGGRISWTSRFFTSTRPGSIRWARTSTTPKSSRPSISTR
jgi:hypothetical protein